MMNRRTSQHRDSFRVGSIGIALVLFVTGCWSSSSDIDQDIPVAPQPAPRDESANDRPDKTLPISEDPAVAALSVRVQALGGQVRRYRIAEPAQPAVGTPTPTHPVADPSKVYVELNFDKAAAVRDADLAAIADEPAFQAVTNIMLGGTAITDEGLKQLAKAKNLEMIDLSQTQVTDAGLEHLAGHPRLSYLMIDGSSISYEAADRLLRTLPSLQGKWQQ